MKLTLLTSLLVVMSTTLFAQADENAILKKDDATGASAYEEVVKLPNVKKEEIFARAKKWIIANIKTSDNNISFNETDYTAVNTAAIKVDKKSFITSASMGGAFDFKFNVAAKDDKYKITIDNIMFYVNMSDGHNIAPQNFGYDELKDNKQGRFFSKQANDKLKLFVDAFKHYMENPTEGSGKNKKDDW